MSVIKSIIHSGDYWVAPMPSNPKGYSNKNERKN